MRRCTEPWPIELKKEIEDAMARWRYKTRSFLVMILQLHEWDSPGGWLAGCIGTDQSGELAKRVDVLLSPLDRIFELADGRLVVICHDIGSQSDAARVAQRFTSEVARPSGRKARPLMISNGAALVTGVHTSAEDVLADAETAMRRAAERPGTRTEVFDEQLRIELMTRFLSINQIARGDEHDEFHLRFQPIVSVEDRSLQGVEALLRWGHPNAPRATPQELVSLAEQTNRMSALGRWVIERAAIQAIEWEAASLATPITTYVNVSVNQLVKRGLVHDMRSILQNAGLEPRHLGIEVTESSLLADEAIEAVRRLREMGVRISLDDFGTGFSGLKSLASLPLDNLKLDMSFVHRMDSPSVRSISAAIVSLAHELGLQVVAEGVESELQLDAVAEIGCDDAQGFLIAKPMTGGEIPRWLSSRTHRTDT